MAADSTGITWDKPCYAHLLRTAPPISVLLPGCFLGPCFWLGELPLMRFSLLALACLLVRPLPLPLGRPPTIVALCMQGMTHVKGNSREAGLGHSEVDRHRQTKMM